MSSKVIKVRVSGTYAKCIRVPGSRKCARKLCEFLESQRICVKEMKWFMCDRCVSIYVFCFPNDVSKIVRKKKICKARRTIGSIVFAVFE